MSTQAAEAVVVVIADGAVDIIMVGEAETKQHVKDLRAMGCGNVKAHRFPSWEKAEAFADKITNS